MEIFPFIPLGILAISLLVMLPLGAPTMTEDRQESHNA